MFGKESYAVFWGHLGDGFRTRILVQFLLNPLNQQIDSGVRGVDP